MKGLEILPGHEIRGFVVRLYPTTEQVERMRELQHQQRIAWNWLVAQVEDSLAATRAYAVRNGLVAPSPQRPDYDGLSPDESKAARKQHASACGEWARSVYSKTKGIDGCAPRKMSEWLIHFGLKHDYQLLRKVIGWKCESVLCGSAILQGLSKSYFQKSARRKTFKRRQDHVPLRVRTGDCFRLGSFGARGKNPEFYNCQVSINGLRIRGRLPGRSPSGRILEGVAVTEQADGWYASIKVEVPVRVLPETRPGSVAGVDVGLKNLAGIVGSDGFSSLVVNGRDLYFADRVADMQQQGLDIGRIHQRAKRHTLHLIYNEIIKPLGAYETIKVEDLNARIGQMGSSMGSSMRTIYRLLVERYGDRVRAVEPAYTSQDCSQCGFRSKETWSYDHGPIGECPSCGHREHRDLNAARNIMFKSPIDRRDRVNQCCAEQYLQPPD